MNTSNWKSIGWLVTRKLLYYALLLVAAVLLFKGGFALMTIANTFAFVLGLLLVVLTVGGLFTAFLREVFFYFKLLNS